MRRFFFTACAIALGWVAGTSVCLAWGDGGHMAIAVRAWDAMTPAQRTGALDLLKHHPRYQQDFLDMMPTGLGPDDQNLWLFARAATWPDYVWKIRVTAPADFRNYFHPSWHVIDEPVTLDPKKQDSMPMLPRHVGPVLNWLTVREALPYSIAQLNDPKLPLPDRAIALCWVMHLTGDLHEPAHTSTLYSRRFPPPYGDHVATRLPISIAGRTSVMHGYWDSLFCTSTDLATLKKWDRTVLDDATLKPDALPELANDLKITADSPDPLPPAKATAHPTTEPAESPEQRQREILVDSWVIEGADLAKKDVYSPEVRAAITTQEADPEAPFKPVVLSDDYMIRAAEIGRRRGALAALRLARLLCEVKW